MCVMMTGYVLCLHFGVCDNDRIHILVCVFWCGAMTTGYVLCVYFGVV